MTIYFLKQNGNLLLNSIGLPQAYTNKTAARHDALFYIADDPIQIVHQNKGVVETVKPLYGVKRQDEWFTFAFREFDVAAAWRLIEKGREMKTISTESAYDYYLKDNDFDFNAESNWSEPNDRGGRRMIKMPSLIGVTIDIKKAMSDEVDYSVPLLVAPIFAEGKFAGHVVIDGWHRAYKAYKQGVKELPAFVLTEKEAKQITRV